jgi:hypothetical protein
MWDGKARHDLPHPYTLRGDACGRAAAAFHLAPGVDGGTDRSMDCRAENWRVAGGHESGRPRFQPPQDLGCARWVPLERQVGTPGDSYPGDADQPQDQQAVGRGGQKELPA